MRIQFFALVLLAALDAAAQKFSSSSALKPSKVASYDARNVFDGDPRTAWCEGAPDEGVGSWVEVPLGPGELLGAMHTVPVTIIPGYTKDPATFTNNAAPSKVRVELRRAGAAMAQAEADCDARCELEIEGPPRAAGEISLRVTVVAVRPGKKWKDTCISEVLPRFDAELAPANGASEAAAAFCEALEKKDAQKLKQVSAEKLADLVTEFTSEIDDSIACRRIELRSATAFDLRHPVMEGDGTFSTRRFVFDGKKWRTSSKAVWPLFYAGAP